jgi:hypothetical protein
MVTIAPFAESAGSPTTSFHHRGSLRESLADWEGGREWPARVRVTTAWILDRTSRRREALAPPGRDPGTE